jgi:recombination protein RecA
MRQKGRYDISIKDNKNYMVGGSKNGVIVHNSPETTTGGNALKFYSSVRLDIRKIETLKKDADFIGNRVRVKVIKNKVAPPFKQAEFDLIFNSGISVEGEIIDVGTKYGVIEKSGAWYNHNGERLGQGRENAKNFLKENSEVKEQILKEIKDKITIKIEDDKDASSIEEAIIFLYDLRHDDGEVVDGIETLRIPWEGKEYSMRQLVHHINKNKLKDELDKKIKEKMALK